MTTRCFLALLILLSSLGCEEEPSPMDAAVADAVADGCGCDDLAESDIVPDRGPGLPAEGMVLAAGDHLEDGLGRFVLLRGVNYMGLEFGWFHQSPDDFALIRQWGFEVVRLPIAWAYLEPAPGELDESYLAQEVDRVLNDAAEAGVTVILGMHQWNWSSCFGGNGIPSWTCEGAGSDIFAMLQAATDFWGQEEYLTRLAEIWAMLAARYRGHPAVLAFDLFNEPNGGHLDATEFDRDILSPVYADLIAAVRAEDPDRVVMIEPALSHTMIDTALSPPEADQVIYAPHSYPGMTWSGVSGYTGDPTMIEEDLDRLTAEAQALGVPLWVGEFGIGSEVEGAAPYITDHLHGQDARLLGGAYWSYFFEDAGFGLLTSDGAIKEDIITALVRPHPKRVAGRPLSFAVEADRCVLVWREEGEAQGPTELFVPEGLYGEAPGVTSTDGDGTWSAEWNGPVLRVVADPEQAEHTVTVGRE